MTSSLFVTTLSLFLMSTICQPVWYNACDLTVLTPSPSTRHFSNRQAFSFINSLIHSFVRSFVPWLVGSFVFSFVGWLVGSFVRSLVRSFDRLFVRSFVRSFALI